MTLVFIYAGESERYALVRGYVGGWFRDHRIPAYRSNMHGGWWLRQERVDDVMARMDVSGLVCRFSDRPAPAYVPPPLDVADEEKVA